MEKYIIKLEEIGKQLDKYEEFTFFPNPSKSSSRIGNETFAVENVDQSRDQINLTHNNSKISITSLTS